MSALGQTAESMWAAGDAENSTERESITRMINNSLLASGRMAREYNGSMNDILFSIILAFY